MSIFSVNYSSPLQSSASFSSGHFSQPRQSRYEPPTVPVVPPSNVLEFEVESLRRQLQHVTSLNEQARQAPVVASLTPDAALRLIAAAKKREQIKIKDCYFPVLTISNSCDVLFKNCSTSKLVVQGDWTVAILTGLKVSGTEPVVVERYTECILNSCEIRSQTDPLKVQGKLKLKRSTVKVVGPTLGLVGESACLRVVDSKLSLLNENTNSTFVSFDQKALCSLETSKIKIKTKKTSFLFDSNNEVPAELSVVGCDVLVPKGKFATSKTGTVATSGVNVHGQDTVLVFSGEDLADLSALVSDPAFAERTVQLHCNIKSNAFFHVFSRTLHVSAFPLSVAKEEASPKTICVFANRRPCFWSKNLQEEVIQYQVPEFELDAVMKFEEGKVTFSNVILLGNLSFEGCKVRLEGCYVFSSIKISDSSLKASHCFFEPREFTSTNTRMLGLNCSGKKLF